MTGLDTNVVLRFLLEDDPHQTAQVRRLLAEARDRREPLYLSMVVLCETVWTLKSVYRKSRQEIANALLLILDADVFQVEEEDNVRTAVQLYQTGRAEFPDYLIGQIHQAHGCRHTVTFDRALHGTPGFSSL